MSATFNNFAYFTILAANVSNFYDILSKNYKNYLLNGENKKYWIVELLLKKVKL